MIYPTEELTYRMRYVQVEVSLIISTLGLYRRTFNYNIELCGVIGLRVQTGLMIPKGRYS